MAEPVSIRAYARFRQERGLSGGSHTAVRKAIAAGRLKAAVLETPDGRPMIDPDLADQEWESQTDPAQQRNPATAIKGPKSPGRPPGPVQKELPGQEKKKEPAPGYGPNYHRHREDRERFQAKLKELEYRRQAQELVEVKEVEIELRRLGRSIRNKLQGIPSRLCGELAGMKSSRKIAALLRKEIEAALRVLSDGS